VMIFSGATLGRILWTMLNTNLPPFEISVFTDY
jgi:hypothetical protein